MRLLISLCALLTLGGCAFFAPTPTLQIEPSIAPPDGRLMTPPDRLTPPPATSNSGDIETALDQCLASYAEVAPRLVLLQGWARRVTGEKSPPDR